MQSLNTIDGAAGLPLCVNQEQLLLSREWLRQHSEAVGVSMTPTVLALRGRLNDDALERALNEIVRRHAALRVRFFPATHISPETREDRLRAFGKGVYTPGLYQQSVCENVAVTLRRVDLTDFGSPIASEEVRNVFYDEATGHFDYNQPPLMHATLLKRGEEDHLLILVVDHAVADAWSMRVVRSELVQLYAHYCGTTPYPLPEPGLQYPDYAVWQNRARASGHFSAATKYWKQQWERFGDARIAFGELPFAETAASYGNASYGAEQVRLDATTCQELRRSARLFRVTLNMFFVAACAVLMQSYTRKNRLGIWSHFSNRGGPDVQNTVGYFAHTHLLGIDLSSGPTGAQLLQQVRQTVLDGYDHQEMPLPHLWQELNCWPRYADARVLVDYHQADEPWEDQPQTSGVVMERAQLPEIRQGRFSSLGLYIRDSRDGMSVTVHYAKDRFQPPAIRHMLEDLQIVIAQFLAGPERKISAFIEKPRYADSPVHRSIEMSEFVRLSKDSKAGTATSGVQRG